MPEKSATDAMTDRGRPYPKMLQSKHVSILRERGESEDAEIVTSGKRRMRSHKVGSYRKGRSPTRNPMLWVAPVSLRCQSDFAKNARF